MSRPVHLIIRLFLPEGDKVSLRLHDSPIDDWGQALASWRFQSLFGRRAIGDPLRFQIIGAVREGRVTAVDCDQAVAELVWAALRAEGHHD